MPFGQLAWWVKPTQATSVTECLVTRSWVRILVWGVRAIRGLECSTRPRVSFGADYLRSWDGPLFQGVGTPTCIIQIHASTYLQPRFLSFVSDCQKGLLEAIELVFSGCPHAYCLRHLYENLHKMFKHPALWGFLCEAARAIEEEYNKALDQMRDINSDAVDLMEHTPQEHCASITSLANFMAISLRTSLSPSIPSLQKRVKSQLSQCWNKFAINWRDGLLPVVK